MKRKKIVHTYPKDSQMIAAARAMYMNEGTLEIDEGAKISRPDGNEEKGAYVQAWVWVPDEEAQRQDPAR